MPSALHEILIEVFRNRPRLVCELLELCTSVHLDAPIVEPGPTDANQVAPAEFRADGVFVLRDAGGTAIHSIVVESQLGPDQSKRSSWPVYVVTARARLECPATLLVIASDRAVARWAREPIEIGHPGFVLAPIVICLEELPHLSEVASGQRTPELALLCALGHPELADAEAALASLHAVDEDRAKLYWDVLLTHLPDAIRQALETHMQGYEYQSEFARKYYGQGREEGREEGLQRAIILLAASRFALRSSQLEEKLRSVTDLELLERLIVSLGQARTDTEARAALEAIAGALS